MKLLAEIQQGQDVSDQYPDYTKKGGRVYRQPNGEDIGYRPVTKSTPALDKMRSKKKIHEDEDQ